jgi:hypothetical protein
MQQTQRVLSSTNPSTDKEVGMKHDYKVYKDNRPELPEDIERMYDLGTCHL